MLVEPTPNQVTLAPEFSGYDYYQAVYRATNFDLDPIHTVEIDDELRGYQEEASMIASLESTRFKQKHPGMGEKEVREFGDIVYHFAFTTARMEQQGMSLMIGGRELPVFRLATLGDENQQLAVAELEPQYLATVFSQERMVAELALSEWWRTQAVEDEAIVK